MIRRRVNHFSIRSERRVDVAETQLLDLAQSVAQLEHVVGRLSNLGFAREDTGELRPAITLLVQPVERAKSSQVLGVDVGDTPVSRNRTVDVFELHLENLCV